MVDADSEVRAPTNILGQGPHGYILDLRSYLYVRGILSPTRDASHTIWPWSTAPTGGQVRRTRGLRPYVILILGWIEGSVVM